MPYSQVTTSSARPVVALACPNLVYFYPDLPAPTRAVVGRTWARKPTSPASSRDGLV